jgi:DNA replication protein DnaC
MFLTSNRGFSEWGEIFRDATIADAILDRIMQRNHRLTPTGDSLRT